MQRNSSAKSSDLVRLCIFCILSNIFLFFRLRSKRLSKQSQENDVLKTNVSNLETRISDLEKEVDLHETMLAFQKQKKKMQDDYNNLKFQRDFAKVKRTNAARAISQQDHEV